MGDVTELVVIGSKDCVVVAVGLLVEMGVSEYTEVAFVDFGGEWVNVEGWLPEE